MLLSVPNCYATVPPGKPLSAKSTVRPPPRKHGISPHPAGEFLASLHQHGVPCVQSDEDWTLELLDERMARGCHRSATEHRDFIREEMADFVESGFYAVLPYPRCDTCLDSGFPLGIRRSETGVPGWWWTIPGSLSTNTPRVDHQRGDAIWRCLYRTAKIYHADPEGPVYLASTTSRTVSTHDDQSARCTGLTVILPNMMGRTNGGGPSSSPWAGSTRLNFLQHVGDGV
jgi:hypothetical protein